MPRYWSVESSHKLFQWQVLGITQKDDVVNNTWPTWFPFPLKPPSRCRMPDSAIGISGISFFHVTHSLSEVCKAYRNKILFILFCGKMLRHKRLTQLLSANCFQKSLLLEKFWPSLLSLPANALQRYLLRAWLIVYRKAIGSKTPCSAQGKAECKFASNFLVLCAYLWLVLCSQGCLMNGSNIPWEVHIWWWQIPVRTISVHSGCIGNEIDISFNSSVVEQRDSAVPLIEFNHESLEFNTSVTSSNSSRLKFS